VVLLAFGLQLEAGAGAATFTFVTIDPPGSTMTVPSGITDDGVIIGYYINSSGVYHGFMRTPDGTITTFDPPGSTFTLPTSINLDGEIAGAYCDTAACASSLGVGARGFVQHREGTFVTFAAPAGQILAPIYNAGGPPPELTPAGAIAGTYSVLGPPFAEHGFLRHRNGTIKTIDVPGATGFTEVLAINPSGTIVGDYSTPTISYAGFIRTPDEKVTTITIPNSCPGNSIPTGGIDPAGEVAGVYSDSTCSGTHGYLRTPGGTITSFDPPGSIATSPYGINAAGAITGNFFTGSTTHGFVRHPSGTIVTFDVPGSTATFPWEINSSGVIIGSYVDAKSVTHGFVRSRSD
jgi:hypothetical protein